MKYFNLKRKIIIDTEVQNLPKFMFEKLNENQLEFLAENPQANYDEVMNLQLKQITPIAVEEYKLIKIEELSQISLNMINSIISDYQIKNALTGVYDEDKSAQIIEKYRVAGTAFRDEFYRVSDLINSAETIDSVDIAFNSKNFVYNA
jgi:hypothetical protein